MQCFSARWVTSHASLRVTFLVLCCYNEVEAADPINSPSPAYPFLIINTCEPSLKRFWIMGCQASQVDDHKYGPETEKHADAHHIENAPPQRRSDDTSDRSDGCGDALDSCCSAFCSGLGSNAIACDSFCSSWQ